MVGGPKKPPFYMPYSPTLKWELLRPRSNRSKANQRFRYTPEDWHGG